MGEENTEKKEEEQPKIKTSSFTEFYKQKYMPEFDKLSKSEKNVHKEFEKTAKDEEQKAIDKSLKTSIKEGSFSSITAGVGDSYISPFAVAIGASNSQIAALTSIPNLIAPLAQLITPKLIEKRKRKSVAVTYVFFQALMWLPLIAISLFFLRNEFWYAPLLLIMFWTVYASFGNLVSPAWSSWMGDLVPADKRGKYFGRRNTICGLIALSSTILAGILLQYFKTAGLLFIAFAVLFSIALIARSSASFLLKRQYEPELMVEKGYYFSFFEFVKKMKNNNFGKYSLYIALLVLTTNIAGPFFTPYVLRELNFSYIQFTIAMIVIPGVVTMLTMPLWGKFTDKYGSVRVMQITWIMVSILPLTWLLSKNFWFICFIPQVLSGIGWAGFNLAAGNFIFDATTRQRRSLCFAYSAVLNGTGVFIGATIGGIIAKYVNLPFINIFFLLFLISGIMRLIVSAIFIPKIKEVRPVERARPLLSYLHIYPFAHLAEKHGDTGQVVK